MTSFSSASGAGCCLTAYAFERTTYFARVSSGSSWQHWASPPWTCLADNGAGPGFPICRATRALGLACGRVAESHARSELSSDSHHDSVTNPSCRWRSCRWWSAVQVVRSWTASRRSHRARGWWRL